MEFSKSKNFDLKMRKIFNFGYLRFKLKNFRINYYSYSKKTKYLLDKFIRT